MNELLVSPSFHFEDRRFDVEFALDGADRAEPVMQGVHRVERGHGVERSE